MKTTFLAGFLLLCTGTLTAQSPTSTRTISIEVSNTWNKDRTDAPVVLKLNDLKPGFQVRSAVVMNGNKEVPSQLDDLNSDLKADELASSSTCLHRVRKNSRSPYLLPRQIKIILHVFLPNYWYVSP